MPMSNQYIWTLGQLDKTIRLTNSHSGFQSVVCGMYARFNLEDVYQPHNPSSRTEKKIDTITVISHPIGNQLKTVEP